MILFLSQSFLLRLRLAWKPDLQAFLVGDRNLYFFVPEVIIETPDLSPSSVDALLARIAPAEKWNLLGMMSPGDQPEFFGYAQVRTNGIADPLQWDAGVAWAGESGTERRKLEVRISEL